VVVIQNMFQITNFAVYKGRVQNTMHTLIPLIFAHLLFFLSTHLHELPFLGMRENLGRKN